MKLGVACSPEIIDGKADWRSFATFWHTHGFDGASVFFNKPLDTTFDDAKQILRIFKELNFEAAQANGWYECLVNPDENLRKEGIRGFIKLCQLGAVIEAPSVYVRPGGMNPAGPWYPHPQNQTKETFDRLVDSLRQICQVVEKEGVLIAIEGHVLSVLNTPEIIRE